MEGMTERAPSERAALLLRGGLLLYGLNDAALARAIVLLEDVAAAPLPSWRARVSLACWLLTAGLRSRSGERPAALRG